MQHMNALACLATTLVISMAGARAQAQMVQAKVPFDFHIRNQVLPAGTYQISHPQEEVILIRSLDNRRFQAFVTIYAADGLLRDDGELVFRKYGTQYFLHEVLCSRANINVDIPVSRQEKQASVEEAGLGSSQTVAALRTGAK
jgi:hypothetical protein